MNMRKIVILSFLASLLLGACGEDDYVYPNVLTDMIDLKTDHTGTGRYLITDEGTEWRIQSRTGLDGLAPDTTYRTVTTLYHAVVELSSSFCVSSEKLFKLFMR